jgi:hypothetical protein
MLEIIVIGLVFWLGYQTGVHTLAWRLRDLLRSAAIKEGIKVDEDFNVLADVEPSKPNVFKLMIEKENGILYLYDYTDNTFVCQGSSINELAELAKEYKNIKYASVFDGKEVVAFIDGKVKVI